MQYLHALTAKFNYFGETYYATIEYIKILEDTNSIIAHYWSSGPGQLDDTANIWKLSTGELTNSFELSGDTSNDCIAIVSNDGKIIIDCRQDTICIRSLETGVDKHSFYISYFPPKAFAITSDNQTWNGKNGYFFVYEYDSTRFAGLEANKVNIPHGKISWCDIDKFFAMNNRIPFAQFKQFCLDKNLLR